VYFQGVGWLPFAPPPPIYETAFNEAERARGSAPAPVTTPRPTPPPTPSVTSPPVTSPPVTTPATSPPITTPPDDVQNPDLEPPDQPETPPIVENKHKSTLPFQLLMILVILIVVTTPIWASVMFVKSVNLSERKRLAKYAVLEDDQTAREAYRFILRLLRLEGLTANPGETPVKFAERVDQAVQGHGLSPVITEIEKLEFSREELLAHEYEKLADCLTELYDRIITDKKALTRFVRRVIIFDVIK
ncbi:MAG: hypothetical protein FWH20_11125, partial [Oscillospiraceae bacterium]|nr:hypothetical protein [Oscillospiraceae bacterium]